MTIKFELVLDPTELIRMLEDPNIEIKLMSVDNNTYHVFYKEEVK